MLLLQPWLCLIRVMVGVSTKVAHLSSCFRAVQLGQKGWVGDDGHHHATVERPAKAAPQKNVNYACGQQRAQLDVAIAVDNAWKNDHFFGSQIIQEMPLKTSALLARCGCKMVLDTEGRQITMAGASALAKVLSTLRGDVTSWGW